MVKLSFTALATVVITFISRTAAISTISSSGFVSSDGSVGFALNLPQKDENEDLYMTLYGPVSSSWIAVGLGSDKMDDTLMFMLYTDATGTGVTLSPRLSTGNVEPSYTNITVKTLAGTGIFNNNYNVNFMCRKCRTWSRGSIDPTSTAQKFIFATGPKGALNSNDTNAAIKRHAIYGTFTMDMTKAVGVSAVPVSQYADTAGSAQGMIKGDKDLLPPFHGCLMIITFVGLLPLGVMILRILNSAKWHGINQVASMGAAVVGVGLGLYTGTMYNRTKKFYSAHQILGIIVTTALIAQSIIGYLHHKTYKGTGSPSTLTPIHIWLGRLIIPAGIINGFLGFPLALNHKYSYALLALVLLSGVVMGPFAFWRWKRDLQKSRTRDAVGRGGVLGGYQAQPWMMRRGQSEIDLSSYGAHEDGGRNHPPIYQHPEAARSFA